MLKVEKIYPYQTYPLRFSVLWPHRNGVDDCAMTGDEEENTFHLGVFSEDRIASIGSVLKESSTKLSMPVQFRLRAMATSPESRGRGLGQELIRCALKEVRSRGGNVLWCDARSTAVDFYKKSGFTFSEEIYEVPQIGLHRFMWIELSGV
ncbi:MAG: GNAT family N-acetyltransferase [Crocinitomicaceae bacterium]|nr:GNAT family N-acetyltransferase [Crocinitomicaceae bacterium]